jgi:hypothetical protein
MSSDWASKLHWIAHQSANSASIKQPGSVRVRLLAGAHFATQQLARGSASAWNRPRWSLHPRSLVLESPRRGESRERRARGEKISLPMHQADAGDGTSHQLLGEIGSVRINCLTCFHAFSARSVARPLDHLGERRYRCWTSSVVLRSHCNVTSQPQRYGDSPARTAE